MLCGLHCCTRAFSSCGAQDSHCGGSSCCRVQILKCRLSSCRQRAWLLHSKWNLLRPGIEPMSPTLAGRFLATMPPGKSRSWLLNNIGVKGADCPHSWKLAYDFTVGPPSLCVHIQGFNQPQIVYYIFIAKNPCISGPMQFQPSSLGLTMPAATLPYVFLTLSFICLSYLGPFITVVVFVATPSSPILTFHTPFLFLGQVLFLCSRRFFLCPDTYTLFSSLICCQISFPKSI